MFLRFAKPPSEMHIHMTAWAPSFTAAQSPDDVSTRGHGMKFEYLTLKLTGMLDFTSRARYDQIPVFLFCARGATRRHASSPHHQCQNSPPLQCAIAKGGLRTGMDTLHVPGTWSLGDVPGGEGLGDGSFETCEDGCIKGKRLGTPQALLLDISLLCHSSRPCVFLLLFLSSHIFFFPVSTHAGCMITHSLRLSSTDTLLPLRLFTL